MPKTGFDFAKPLFSILFVVAVWQFAHAAGFTNKNLFPGPWEVGVASIKLYTDGVMMKDLRTSVSRAAVGFSIGASLGILAGILTSRVSIVRLAIYPFFNILRPIPAIALVPIAIVWFGIGESQNISLSLTQYFWRFGWPLITEWNMCLRLTFALHVRLGHHCGGNLKLSFQLQHRTSSPTFWCRPRRS